MTDAEPVSPGSPLNGPMPLMRWARAVGADLIWLVVIHGLLLCGTAITGGIDAGDVRVHLALLVFLLPGWCLAKGFMTVGGGVEQRYLLATIISLSAHSVLAIVGSRWGLGFDHYYVAFVAVVIMAFGLRAAEIRREWIWRVREGEVPTEPLGGTRVQATHIGLGDSESKGSVDHPAARQEPRPPDGVRAGYQVRLRNWPLLLFVVAFICAVYRLPHSNDIPQFLPQQIDATVQRTLTPSSIGMSAFGINEPMPRWKANVWHVWFSLLADVTHLPVEGLVLRWATIPVASWALLSLAVCVGAYAGQRTPRWAVLLAILGPVTLWFRQYNAYVYAFRLTNNLCLDKDLALFWLIPAWLWLWLRAVKSGETRAWVLLLALVPLCLKLHPITSVYLLLLLPFALIHAVDIRMPGSWRSLKSQPPIPFASLCRCVLGAGLVIGMFLAMYLSGDAQASHQQIETLVHLDARQSLAEGRPLHYWAGHYNTVAELNLSLDTTEWQAGHLRLKLSLLSGCSLQLVWPLALLIFGLTMTFKGARTTGNVRSWLAGAAAFAVACGLFLSGTLFLSQAPHLYRGFERLHWCCFIPALVSVASLLALVEKLPEWGLRWCPQRRTIRWIVTLLLVLHLTEQTWHVGRGEPTLMSRVRVFNSLFDSTGQSDPDQSRRASHLASIGQVPIPPRPVYLREDDRVLPLSLSGPIRYWEMRQAVWWRELYGEAHTLSTHGTEWLPQWQAFYAAVDHRPSQTLDEWLVSQKVTLILDDRPSAARFVDQLAKRLDRSASQVAPGVWRIAD